MNAEQRADAYFHYLVAQYGPPTELNAVEATNADLGHVFIASYHNHPEPGLHTIFSYGLSEASHTEWTAYRPELCLTVESDHIDWALALADLVDWNRETSPFLPASLFHLGRNLGPETAMDSILIYNPAIAREQELTTFTIDDRTISVLAAYPIYHEEVGLLQHIGINKFVELPEYGLFSISRPDLSALYRVGH